MEPSSAPQQIRESTFWLSPTLWLALVGGIVLWAAFPPLNWWPLAWLATVPWLLLIRLPKLPGRWPYAALWLAGFVHWLFLLEGIRRAHPALYLGWIVLSAYLACYLSIFVGLTRVAVHRLGISIVLAAPVVWVGLELVRGYFVTGFSAGLLAHTQTAIPILLQVSDLAGAYTVSFVMMLVTACLTQVLPVPAMLTELPELRRWKFWPIAVAVLALALALGYGAYRLQETPPLADREPLRVALVQGSLDTFLESDPVRAQARIRETYDHYRQLSDEARRENPRLDLVIWPESSFVLPESLVEEPLRPPPDAHLSPDEVRRRIAAMNEDFLAMLAAEAARVNEPAAGAGQSPPTALIVCGSTYLWGAEAQPKVFNTAFLADPHGKVVARYQKMHAVMFGEYIPLGDRFPWIYRLVPMSHMSVGDGPRAFEVAGLRMAPSICFESVVPHLIRRQVVQLEREQKGQPVDVLVNVTNDGWFWGSAILDLHFRCAIFRAIENRKPMLIAANTGLSAWIDANGIVHAQGPRRQPKVLVAEVRPDGRRSLYHLLGDWPAWLCAAACLALAIAGWRTAKRRE